METIFKRISVRKYEDRIAKVDATLRIGEKLHVFTLVPLRYSAEDRPWQDRYDESRIYYIG